MRNGIFKEDELHDGIELVVSGQRLLQDAIKRSVTFGLAVLGIAQST